MAAAMDNRNAIVTTLNKAIEIEHTLGMQCYQQALTLRGLWRVPFASYLEQLGEEAREHARKFGQKVVALGGVPATSLRAVTRSDSIEAMLRDNIALERAALDAYMKALELAQDDVALRTMLEDHIEAEQRHVEELTLLVEESAVREASDAQTSMRRAS